MNPEQFDTLSRLSAGDYHRFVCNRRQLIAQMMDSHEDNRNSLQILQHEIDYRLAVAATPRQSIDEMMVLLDERVAELWQLTRRLEALSQGDDERPEP